jgi:hypothetical protein
MIDDANLRRALRERDAARYTCEMLKQQLKTMRQELRKERAEHKQTAAKLEAEKNRRGYFPPEP